jgi:tetratricopeptide (TPR) repeat protein
LALAKLLCLFLLGRAFAQSGVDCNTDEAPPPIPPGSYRAIEFAIEALANDDYSAAEQRLLDISDGSEAYERAIVYQTLGFVYSQQGPLKRALEAFREALETNALPRAEHANLTHNVGQIYIADEQFELGVEFIARYLEIACEPPPATAHMLLANAHAQLEQYEPALLQVDLALDKTDEPLESWLQLKLALHYELADLDACVDTLITLIAMTPESNEYWKQLSGILLQNDNTEDSLAVLALAERQGLLKTERDLKGIANIYVSLDIPYKAGVLLREGLDNGTIEATADNLKYLSDVWIAAHEWDSAEGALRRAASLSSEGDLWARLAQVQIEKEAWQEAKETLSRAVNAGVSDMGQTQYLLGIAAYEAGDTRTAEGALTEASRYPEFASQSRQWLQHIQDSR